MGLVFTNIFNTSLSDILEKGRVAQIGEIREWKGVKYQKTPNGWIPVKRNRMVAKKEDGKESSKGILSSNEIKQFVTVAPYFRSKLTSGNKEEMVAQTKSVYKYAKGIADEIGLSINPPKPMGGVYLGSSEISWQYEINSGNQEKVDLFASLMGDLSNEYQDAVIAANYTPSPEDEKTNAIEVTLNKKGAKTEDIEKDLQALGIEGASYHFDVGELTFFIDKYNYDENGTPVLKTDEETDKDIDKILSLTQKGYEYGKQRYQNSRYLGNQNRQKTYRSWLSSGQLKGGSKLYSACEKALAICKAAEGFYVKANDESATQEEKVEEEKQRFAAAKRAAEEFDKRFESSGGKIEKSLVFTSIRDLLYGGKCSQNS